MKKALAILMILALVGSAAFAEITFGAWGRGIFMPVVNDGVNDSTATNAATWGNPGDPRIGFTVAGNSDNVGFQIDILGDNGISNGDQAKIWVKPMDMVTVIMGQFFEDTLRGNAAFGSFNWYRAYGSGIGEDVTFTRFASGDDIDKKNYNSEQGFMVALKPSDAVFLGVAVCGLDNTVTENLAKKIQVGGGYTIEGIGMIRAQYFAQPNGAAGPDADTDGVFEVAFKVTAVENLYADIGFRMFTNTDYHADEKKTVSAYANYKVDAATLHVLAIYDMNKEDDGYNFGAGVDYSLDGGIGVNADVRYTNDIMNGGTDAKTTFFAGLTKGFSNGLIGAGVEVANAADTGYAIPVRMEYWF